MTIQTRPGRFRHTVILTATEKGLERFESLEAMPPLLRAQCLKALESRESGTVVIAGQAEASPRQPEADAVLPAAAARAPACLAERNRGAWSSVWLLLAVVAAACILLWRG